MVKTTVYLDSAVAISLRRLAERQRRSQAELIREALRNYTRQARQPLPPGMGKYRSGQTDLSERTEEVLTIAAKHRRWR